MGQEPQEPVVGRIFQINTSPGGVPKLPARSGSVRGEGLAGDAHDDVRNHGGPQRALCLYTLEEIARLHAEGHPIYPGSAGENITLEGIALSTLVPGVRLALGDRVEIEITSYASPCKTITHSFTDGDFSRISQKLHPGESRVYARVLREGEVRVGDSVRVVLSA